MAHIHQSAGQFDGTVSAFILKNKPRTLLLHRHKILGLWLQPGGHIELNEHPWHTMKHELEEETGYLLHQLDVLQAAPAIPGLVENPHPVPLTYRSHFFPGTPVPHFHTDAAYGFVTNEEPLESLGEGESKVLHWFTADELASVPNDDIYPDTRTIGLHLLENLDNYLKVPATSFNSDVMLG